MESIQSRFNLHVLKYLFRILFCIVFAGVMPVIRPVYAVTYMTMEAGLKNLVPEADSFIKSDIELSPSELQEISESAGKKIAQKTYELYIGIKNRAVAGYAMVLDVKGKEKLITFLITSTPDGNISGVEVLSYRETQGFEIRNKKFLRQFEGKTNNDPLKINRDIKAVSGATLSSQAAGYAVKKALAIFNVCRRKGCGNISAHLE